MIQPAHRLPAAILAATLALAALLSLWAPAAGARRAASCAARGHRRAVHAKACGRSRHRGARRVSPHARTRTGARRGSATTHAAAGAATKTPPVCEDGRAAVRNGEGVLLCADGSAPACREGASATASSEGVVLYCTTMPTADPTEDCANEDCEERSSGEGWSASPCRGGAAATLEEGAFSCPDGNEPSCPEGTQTTLSQDETELVCEPAAPAGERRG